MAPEAAWGRPELAVGAVVIEQDRLLLVKRAQPPADGQWSVPGGRVEAGETMAKAVEREVAEETGLAVDCGRFIGWVERIAGSYHFVILDFEASLRVDDQTPMAGDDAAEVAWVSLDQLDQLPLVAGLMEFLVDHGIVGDR